MSTRKVKDGTTIKTTSTTTKAKKPTTTKKELPKNRVSSRTQSKKTEDDEEKKVKKQVLKVPLSQNTRKVVSKAAAPTKKIGNAPKTSSSRPVTPPSSRVTKSQFFPSKKMYSNALKDVSNKEVTLKKEDSLKTASDVSPDTSSMSDRPRTATLCKGSIVNKNIVGPEVSKKLKTPVIVNSTTSPKILTKVKAPVTIDTKVLKNIPTPAVPVEEPSVEYEDDFDSYESDFEDESSDSPNLSTGTITTSDSSSESDTVGFTSATKRAGSASTDDEKKMDSGNYELPEAKHKQILDNIKESIEKENANLNHNRSNLGSLSDEGFEDGKSLQFINFLGAQKKYKHRKSVELRRKRGEEILSMIRLDQYSFTLFDLAPVPYDVFIKNFGKSNTVQESVQTGDDDVNEEIQTEEILFENKWTQCPPYFAKIEDEENFWEIYKCNYLGVGGDFSRGKTEIGSRDSDLEKFLANTGNMVLNLLNEEDKEVATKTVKSNIPFSKSYISYNTHKHEILKFRPINDVIFCSYDFDKILTVHGKKKEEDIAKSFLCLWDLSDLDSPEMIFVMFGDVTCCTFSSNYTNLIFGGLTNGCLTIWDMSENSVCHKNVYSEEQSGILLRSPTYSTEVEYGHCSRIVSIQSVTRTTQETNLFFTPRTSEICSLDEDATVIIWSIILKEESQGRITERQGLAHWGSVIITINSKILLKNLYPEIDDFRCTALGLSHFDSNNLYISTSHGIIIHCLASGSKTSVKKFYPDIQTQANCIDMCPFSSQYFMVGFDNGDINFYSRTIERPLMVLSNKDSVENKSAIEILQWSQNRPLIFYTKDFANTIHVWNLKVSDMFPVCSIPFKDKVLCMKLSPVIINNSDTLEKTYMMLATENGAVHVHLLGDEHDQLPLSEFEKDKRKFLNYINRYV